MSSGFRAFGDFGSFNDALVELVNVSLPRTASIWVEAEGGHGNGSGWSYDGTHVVTNHHVIDGMHPECRVRFSGQLEQHGTVVGSDAKTDLAVIKIDKMPVTPFVVRVDPPPRRGEFVMTLGCPLAIDETVSIGIVSGLGRQVPLTRDVKIEEAIQTDATINPGNSGGPLVDMSGKLIGVNFASRANASQMNFAIPAEIVQDVVPELIRHGNVRRANLGVGISAVPSMVNGELRSAVEVQAVQEGSPLRRGDLILAINGNKVQRRYDLMRHLNRSAIGKTATLHVFRNKDVIEIEVQPRESQA
jgi:S1-C subfamily serine protease